MTARADRLVAMARRNLPPEVAERWIALIRPAVRLRSFLDGRRRVGQLGVVPLLPDGVDWPAWEGEGPLNFVASIDCGRLPAEGLDLALPDSGTLLFFYFDPEPGYFGSDYTPRTVGVRDPESMAGARVLYVPADVPAVERATPAEIVPYDEVPLAATSVVTGPDWFHPDFRGACRSLSDADRAFLEDHGNRDAFMSAVRRLVPAGHQFGGHATPEQDAVELDVARVRLGVWPGEWDAVVEEGRRWALLAQIGSDAHAGMMWGDAGALYWLVRPEDLAAGDFRDSSFTWQCG